jgi:hypothetical protein
MTIKRTPAMKAALVAFRGLQADEEALVLRELGLVRVPVAAGVATPGADVAVEMDAVFPIDDFMAVEGEGIGLPHPDLMTPEQKALYFPERRRTQSKAAERIVNERQGRGVR